MSSGNLFKNSYLQTIQLEIIYLEKQGNQREEFNVKVSQHYNISVLMNHHQDGWQLFGLPCFSIFFYIVRFISFIYLYIIWH